MLNEVIPRILLYLPRIIFHLSLENVRNEENVDSAWTFSYCFFCVATVSGRGFSPLLSVIMAGEDAPAAWGDIRPRMLWRMRWWSARWGWIRSLMTGKIVAFRPRWPLWRGDRAKARWKVKVILSSSFPHSCHRRRLRHRGPRHVITLLLALGRLHHSFKE